MFRDAFKRALIYEHRITTTSITSSSVDSREAKVYIGLSDGHIEEYRLDSSATYNKLNLSARKSVSNKVSDLFAKVFLPL